MPVNQMVWIIWQRKEQFYSYGESCKETDSIKFSTVVSDVSSFVGNPVKKDKSTTLGSLEIEIRKLEFLAKIQFLLDIWCSLDTNT